MAILLMGRDEMAELKQCPFCGRIPTVEDCGTNRWFVRCKCGIAQDKLYAQKCDAVRAWNRRKSGRHEIELVRCKDCRWGREVCGNIECFVDSNLPPEYHGYEWFCPNGEREGGQDE